MNMPTMNIMLVHIRLKVCYVLITCTSILGSRILELLLHVYCKVFLNSSNIAMCNYTSCIMLTLPWSDDINEQII